MTTQPEHRDLHVYRPTCTEYTVTHNGPTHDNGRTDDWGLAARLDQNRIVTITDYNNRNPDGYGQLYLRVAEAHALGHALLQLTSEQTQETCYECGASARLDPPGRAAPGPYGTRTPADRRQDSGA